LAEIAFFTMYFGTKSDYQSLIGFSLYLIGLAAVSYGLYIDEKNLPESRKPHPELSRPVV